MASRMLSQNHRTKKLLESFRVRVPRRPSSSSSALRNPRKHCKHLSSCSSAQLMIQNYSSFKQSGAPSRFMFYDDGSWLDFPSQVLDTFRSAFFDRRPVIDVQIEGSKFLIDFLRMLQIDFGTGNQRSIAWIDDNGKCFFPKVFIGEEYANCMAIEDNPKIEIEIRIDGDHGKRKREVAERNEKETEVNSTNKREDEYASKKLRLTASEVEIFRWSNAKALREGDRAHSAVSNLFLSGIRKSDPGATITAIHQCTRTGPLERARFEVFQKQNEITRASRGTSNTVYAWYGTSRNAVGGILTHGFGEPSKVPASDSYGVGVYLSPVSLPHISNLLLEADDNGEKHLILCRVILGNVEKVEAGSQQSHPSSVDFDTAVDDPRNPKWYVVWSTNMNRHILPECVVSYKSSNHMPGQLKGSSYAKHSLVKLLSKMKDSLPPSKVQEVANLFETFKAGKLAKDVLVKQLRSIAGDEMLLSTIREIRGCE